jgi:cytochrome c
MSSMAAFREPRKPGRSPLLWIASALIGVVICAACGVATKPVERLQVAGGDPGRGRTALEAYGCGACHQISGVANARGLVGPSLDGVGSRRIIAGYLPNTPENLEHWIQDPQSVAPGNAMPNMNVTDQDARDMAAYLYTLK